MCVLRFEIPLTRGRGLGSMPHFPIQKLIYSGICRCIFCVPVLSFISCCLGYLNAIQFYIPKSEIKDFSYCIYFA